MIAGPQPEDVAGSRRHVSPVSPKRPPCLCDERHPLRQPLRPEAVTTYGGAARLTMAVEQFRDSCHPTNSMRMPGFPAPSSYSGRWAVKSASLPKPSGPERLSFPPEVNGNSQRFRTVLCVIEGPPPCTITSPNRLQSIDETSYVVCRTLVCISGPVSLLVRRLRGAPINNRGGLQKSSGTRRILPTLLLTVCRKGADRQWGKDPSM